MRYFLITLFLCKSLVAEDIWQILGPPMPGVLGCREWVKIPAAPGLSCLSLGIPSENVDGNKLRTVIRILEKRVADLENKVRKVTGGK